MMFISFARLVEVVLFCSKQMLYCKCNYVLIELIDWLGANPNVLFDFGKYMQRIKAVTNTILYRAKIEWLQPSQKHNLLF